MKKFYFVLVCAAAMFFAVDANAQLGVGVGYNLGSNFTSLDDDAQNLSGFYLEATYDWNFIDKSWGSLALQPGVRFSYVGEADSEEEFGVKLKASTNETYLDIPVNVKYSYDLGSVKLSAFAGPVFSMGLTSTKKLVTKADGETGKIVAHNYTGKVVTKGDGATGELEGGVTDYGRFDIKVGVGVGATVMDKLNVKVGYNFGTLNRYTGEADVRYSTNVFYVGLGFMF